MYQKVLTAYVLKSTVKSTRSLTMRNSSTVPRSLRSDAKGSWPQGMKAPGTKTSGKNLGNQVETREVQSGELHLVVKICPTLRLEDYLDLEQSEVRFEEPPASSGGSCEGVLLLRPSTSAPALSACLPWRVTGQAKTRQGLNLSAPCKSAGSRQRRGISAAASESAFTPIKRVSV